MILYGQPVAEKIYAHLVKEIEQLKVKNIMPQLAVILVGEDPASLKYIQLKEKKAQELGIAFKLYHLPKNAMQKTIEDLITDLNKNKFVHGIIIQLPLPVDFETDKLLGLIQKNKDIDGFLGEYSAPTTAAILEIMKYYNIDLNNLPAGRQGKRIVLVGRGKLVGQPLEKFLTAQGYEPLVCDSKTKTLAEKTKEADILISAAGVPGLIKSNMVKDGAVVIDVGTSESNGKMVGDVDAPVYQKNISYTPNHGGVGPVTVAYLMKNLVEAASHKF